MAKKMEQPAVAPDTSAAVDGLLKVLEALTTQLAALNQRLDKLQTAGLPIAGAVAAAPVPAPEPAPALAPAEEGIAAALSEEEQGEELLLAISAAVAAYLGKRPRIRAIRLVSTGDWAQQGRVFVQASHSLKLAREF